MVTPPPYANSGPYAGNSGAYTGNSGPYAGNSGAYAGNSGPYTGSNAEPGQPDYPSISCMHATCPLHDSSLGPVMSVQLLP